MKKYIRPYLGLFLLAILLMSVEVTGDLLQPRLMTRIVDEGVLGTGADRMGVILATGLFMAAVVVVGFLGGSLNGLCAQTAAQRAGNDMRKDLLAKILSLSHAEIEDFSVGALVTRVTSDITQVQNMMTMVVRGMIRTGLQLLGSLFFLFVMNPHFAGTVLLGLPPLLLVIFLCLRRAGPQFLELQGALDRVNEILQEDIAGIRVIKACVQELREKARFEAGNRTLTDLQLHILILFALLTPATQVILYGVIALILFQGKVQVQAGQATPGMVMASVTYTTQLLNAILRMVMMSQSVSRGSASMNRIRQVLDRTSSIRDGEGAMAGNPGEIIFEKVSFAYPGSDRQVLHDVSLTIHPGETVALMGATGSGKSTLVNLIPRFYDVTRGRVLVGGQDVRSLPAGALRSRIAMVLQRSELFSRSVRENLLWGRETASEEELCAAARIAQADEFIREMPDGYDTVLSERGMSVSGGQRQRLCIARALLKKADILILDDATSALDLVTEKRLYDGLRTIKGQTRIVIAQRVATARRADRILLLSGGTILAQGTHEELLSVPLYRELCASQMEVEQ